MDNSDIDTPLNSNIADEFMNTYEIPDGVDVIHDYNANGARIFRNIYNNSKVRDHAGWMYNDSRAKIYGRIDKYCYWGIATDEYYLYIRGDKEEDVSKVKNDYIEFATSYEKDKNTSSSNNNIGG